MNPGFLNYRFIISQNLLCRALLFGGMRESQPGTTEVELKDTSSSAFSVLLKYIYTGRINLLEIKVWLVEILLKHEVF